MHLRPLALTGVVALFLTTFAASSPPAVPAVPTKGWGEAEAIVNRIAPPTFPPRNFPVTDYGAVGDGKTDCRNAIAKAVEACNRAGGGHVIVPHGVYFCDGPVHLASNVDLHLDEGSTLKFGADPAKYLPPVLARFEGTMLYAHSPRIYARGCKNVAITGHGTIDGNGLATRQMMEKAPGRGSSGQLRKMGADGVPVKERVFGEGKWLRSSFIQPFECENVLIENVTLLDSMFWVVHPTLCKNVTVRGITVNSLNSNNDGCDPDSSSYVLIENCRFNSGDDCIAIKSGRDRDGWTVGRPSENIVIRHCTMTTRHGAICIGSEMSGNVRNVFVEECRISSAAAALLFKANLDRGGIVENVHVRDITADRVHDGIQFQTNYQGYRGGKAAPQFRGFVLQNIHVKEASDTGIRVEGAPGVPIRRVLFQNVRVDHAKRPYVASEIANVHLENTLVNGVLLPEMFPGASEGTSPESSPETRPAGAGADDRQHK